MKVNSSIKGRFNLLASLCVLLFSTYNLNAQNPANYTSATYIGGYHIKCNGQSTATIKANPSFGTAPYTFLWSTGETTAQISNKPAGIYIVTMIDSLNDTLIDTFELRQPYALGYQSTLSDYYGYNIEAQGGHRGAIQLAAKGGTPPYRYLWNNGDSAVNRTGLTAGTYTFTITDANQCSTNGSITLTEPNPIQISFNGIENPKCFKSKNGKATIDITGGLGDFSVVWNNGNFSLSPEDLSSGFNAVRIYERGNAVLDTGITLTSPDEIDVQFNFSDYNGYNVSCVDCFNGSITTTINGGTAPYTYLWDDASNSTTASLSNLNGGEYNLMIIDANNCKSTNNAQLTMPTPKDWSRTGNTNIDTAEFIGSTDTSAVVFKSNNQEALRLVGNGNVGVKNATPTEALDIIGNLKTSGVFKFKNNGYISPLTDANGVAVGMQFGSGTIAQNSIPSQPKLACLSNYSWQTNFENVVVIRDPQTNGVPALYLASRQGKALIESSNEGTTSLNTKLFLNSLCGEDVIVGNSVEGNLIATVKLGVGTDSPSEKLHVVGSGLFDENLYVTEKIGVGTTTPQYKLDVAGSINANSFLRDGVEMRGSQWSEATNDANNICYNSGNVGIGHCEPAYLLHLKGNSTDIMLENTNASGSNLPNKFIISSANGHGRLISDHGITFFIDSDNNEDIGSSPYMEYFRIVKNAGSYNNDLKDLFYINGEGTGYIRELYVQEPLSNNGNSYPDYVFDDKYNLMSLADFSRFIKKEKHLPNIPTAVEVKKENKGLAVSDMLLKLLKTQEEQALYIVQLHEQNELLKKQVELLLK